MGVVPDRAESRSITGALEPRRLVLPRLGMRWPQKRRDPEAAGA
jgi:hypothetical protein